MELIIGKYYLTRGRSLARIFDHYSDQGFYMGAVTDHWNHWQAYSWQEDGYSYENKIYESAFDLCHGPFDTKEEVENFREEIKHIRGYYGG